MKDTTYGNRISPQAVSQRIKDKIRYLKTNTDDELNAFSEAYILRLADCLETKDVCT